VVGDRARGDLTGRRRVADALDAALDVLRCPVCSARLARGGAVVRCERGHAFDVARQGYLSLLAGAATAAPGDTAAMVQARTAFLRSGAFAPLREAVVSAAADGPDGVVVDLGAGTGWFLTGVLDRRPGRLGIALDISKPALRRAARAHPRAAAVGADAWGALPLRDACAAVVLGVFAPRNGPEVRRILVPGGRLVVVTPTARHLRELVAPLGLLGVDARKDERLAAQLEGDVALERRDEREWAMTLDRDAVAALAGMGPSAFHGDEAARAERIAALPEPVVVTASVRVSIYRRG
jgi:23S rRNA (guanine745-N1)-methyltransferase